jgi:predicted  nucleic acid-binding Zn-ribbon protein
MATLSITSQLQAFREKAKVDQLNLDKINQESPFDRMRREIQDELDRSEKYRASILQNVTTFGKSYAGSYCVFVDVVVSSWP